MWSYRTLALDLVIGVLMNAGCPLISNNSNVVTVSFILMLNRGDQCCSRDLLVKGIRLYRFEMVRKITYLRFERSIEKNLERLL